MKRFIEGEDRGQGTLLPEGLDDYVTQGNPARVVDVFVDELNLCSLRFERMRPAKTGRPAYHPAVLLKLYIYGYLNRNLGDALDRYEWRFNFKRIDGQPCSGKTFAQSEAVLGDLQRQLRAALDAKNDAMVCNAAVEVVRWGGVVRYNERWLRDQQSGLGGLLGTVKTAIETQDDAADFGPDLRFNAGMTKVYSLMLDNFVIYDSRVPATLAWFMMARAREQKLDAIPPALQFACMNANEGPKVAQPKCRNPRTDQLHFPSLYNRPALHNILWNLRAPAGSSNNCWGRTPTRRSAPAPPQAAV